MICTYVCYMLFNKYSILNRTAKEQNRTLFEPLVVAVGALGERRHLESVAHIAVNRHVDERL